MLVAGAAIWGGLLPYWLFFVRPLRFASEGDRGVAGFCFLYSLVFFFVPFLWLAGEEGRKTFRSTLSEQLLIKIESLGWAGLCWSWGVVFRPNPRSAMGWFPLVIWP